MLAYILALAVAFGSFSLYMAAFFFPEVHRKYDLIWSGVGMFYALVLWVCAGRITGGVLLGQVASVALLAWLGWQTLTLRRWQTPVTLRTQIPDSATTVPDLVQATVKQLRMSFQKSAERSPIAAKLDRGLERASSFVAALGTRLGAQPAPRSPSPSPDQNISSPSTLMNAVPSNPDPTSQPHRYASQSLSPAATSGAEPESSPEIYAEWDDLDLEFHPELDTIEGPLTNNSVAGSSVAGPVAVADDRSSIPSPSSELRDQVNSDRHPPS